MGKKKTLITMFEDFHEERPACPICKSNTNVIKNGVRTLKEDTIQAYLCKSCNKRFSQRKFPHFLPTKGYPGCINLLQSGPHDQHDPKNNAPPP